jgi:hypothetical protein
MADVSHTSVNLSGQALDTYTEVRDDLDTLMGDLESAGRLVTFIVMSKTEDENHALSPDFVGALFSIQNLLEAFKSRGDAMVHRMMVLEDGAASAAGKAVRS